MKTMRKFLLQGTSKPFELGRSFELGRPFEMDESGDGSFEVDRSVALQSLLLRDMIEEEDVKIECADGKIPLPMVSGKVLRKVVEYCKRHAGAAESGKGADDCDLRNWDVRFIRANESMLFDLTLAANYMNIPSLLDLALRTLSDEIENYSVEDVRKLFNIENDFSPDEERKIRAENPWAFEAD